jgi:hypothetical protein
MWRHCDGSVDDYIFEQTNCGNCHGYQSAGGLISSKFANFEEINPNERLHSNLLYIIGRSGNIGLQFSRYSDGKFSGMAATFRSTAKALRYFFRLRQRSAIQVVFFQRCLNITHPFNHPLNHRFGCRRSLFLLQQSL